MVYTEFNNQINIIGQLSSNDLRLNKIMEFLNALSILKLTCRSYVEAVYPPSDKIHLKWLYLCYIRERLTCAFPTFIIPITGIFNSSMSSDASCS